MLSLLKKKKKFLIIAWKKNEITCPFSDAKKNLLDNFAVKFVAQNKNMEHRML